jgi:hypothetical protein
MLCVVDVRVDVRAKSGEESGSGSVTICSFDGIWAKVEVVQKSILERA